MTRSNDDATRREKLDAAAVELLTAIKEGREPNMPDGITYHVNYGSGSKTCKCNCPVGDCDHQWDGESIEIEGGFSVTCSRCGMAAMSHDMWIF